MKNADIPAMPQSATNEGHSCYYYDYNGPGAPTGLTKREMMAMHMMAGLNANPTVEMNENDMATLAVIYADALLQELNITSK